MEATDTTRDRVKAAATELFTERGYDKTSLREIADRVGITKASLYYHYPSKQALLLAIMEPFLLEWAAAVEMAERLPHTSANIRAVLAREIDITLCHREAIGLLVRDIAAVITAAAPRLAYITQLVIRLRTWLAGPNPSQADEIRAATVTEMLRTPLFILAERPDLAEDEVRRVVLDTAERVLGLRPDAVGPG